MDETTPEAKKAKLSPLQDIDESETQVKSTKTHDNESVTQVEEPKTPQTCAAEPKTPEEAFTFPSVLEELMGTATNSPASSAGRSGQDNLGSSCDPTP